MYNRIDLSLSPSATVGVLAAGPWLGLGIVALIAAWHGPVPVLAMVPVAIAGMISRWRRCGTLSHPQAVVRLVVSQGPLTATLANGSQLDVTITGGSRTSGTLTFLELRPLRPGSARSVILAPVTGLPFNLAGNTAPDALRRLRVWLRLMPVTGQSPAPAVPRRTPLTRFWPGGKAHVRDT